jgi:hypothetical protein
MQTTSTRKPEFFEPHWREGVWVVDLPEGATAYTIASDGGPDTDRFVILCDGEEAAMIVDEDEDFWTVKISDEELLVSKPWSA